MLDTPIDLSHFWEPPETPLSPTPNPYIFFYSVFNFLTFFFSLLFSLFFLLFFLFLSTIISFFFFLLIILSSYSVLPNNFFIITFNTNPFLGVPLKDGLNVIYRTPFANRDNGDYRKPLETTEGRKKGGKKG